MAKLQILIRYLSRESRKLSTSRAKEVALSRYWQLGPLEYDLTAMTGDNRT